MLDLHTLSPAVATRYGADISVFPAPAWRTTFKSSALLAAALDEVGFGVLVVDEDVCVLHANHAAIAELRAPDHPLQLLGDHLRAQRPHDVSPLRQAVTAAAYRGVRQLVSLPCRPQPLSIAVVPLGTPQDRKPAAVLVMLGRRCVRQELSVRWFARAHGLTPAEANVLEQLCAGDAPAQIARTSGVAISTVRAQISSIRSKTGMASIRDLVRHGALLPPLIGALRVQLL